MSEIELKFLLDESRSSELWARVKALKLANGNPKTRTLRSIYLDTPEQALKKAGIALRLRRDGRRPAGQGAFASTVPVAKFA